VGGQHRASAALPPPPPRERPCTHCTGGCVVPRGGLDVCEQSHSHRDSIPGMSSPEPHAIPTELPGPLMNFISTYNYTYICLFFNLRIEFQIAQMQTKYSGSCPLSPHNRLSRPAVDVCLLQGRVNVGRINTKTARHKQSKSQARRDIAGMSRDFR
jgi:hypothetical protein